MTDADKFLACVNELCRRYQSRTKVAETVKTAAAAVVDNLISRHVIEPESRDQMINNLCDHRKCLVFMDKLAGAVRPAELGQPYSKTAQPHDCRIERESDRVFEEILLRRASSVIG